MTCVINGVGSLLRRQVIALCALAAFGGLALIAIGSYLSGRAVAYRVQSDCDSIDQLHPISEFRGR
jgi:hypothetical protein